MVYLGADHRGFATKEKLKARLLADKIEVEDLGAYQFDPVDDYVDFAKSVAEKVIKNPKSMGVLLCGSAVGMDIVANKIRGIRCGLVTDVKRAIQSRAHEDINVVSIPTDIVDEENTYQIVKAFLNTPASSEERHMRRRNKLQALETN